jgi:hypothetical protein
VVSRHFDDLGTRMNQLFSISTLYGAGVPRHAYRVAREQQRY